MYSETPDIMSFSSPFRIDVLAKAQLETLQAGTLRLLDEVGIHFPSPRALQIFADHGARVDWEQEVVCIPPDLVRKAMASAPRSFVLGGREERLDLLLDGSRSYLCTDGTGVHVIDPETRQRRASRKEDIARMARVADALPMIGFFWPMVSAQDYGVTAPLHQCHAGLTNTEARARRHDRSPAVGALRGGDGDGGGGERGDATHALADLRQHLHHLTAGAG